MLPYFALIAGGAFIPMSLQPAMEAEPLGDACWPAGDLVQTLLLRNVVFLVSHAGTLPRKANQFFPQALPHKRADFRVIRSPERRASKKRSHGNKQPKHTERCIRFCPKSEQQGNGCSYQSPINAFK